MVQALRAGAARDLTEVVEIKWVLGGGRVSVACGMMFAEK
jgi:hypothetical protein